MTTAANEVKTFTINKLEYKLMQRIPAANDLFHLNNGNSTLQVRTVGVGRNKTYQIFVTQPINLNGEALEVAARIQLAAALLQEANIQVSGGSVNYGHNDWGYALESNVSGWATINKEETEAVKTIQRVNKTDKQVAKLNQQTNKANAAEAKRLIEAALTK